MSHTRIDPPKLDELDEEHEELDELDLELDYN